MRNSSYRNLSHDDPFRTVTTGRQGRRQPLHLPIGNRTGNSCPVRTSNSGHLARAISATTAGSIIRGRHQPRSALVSVTPGRRQPRGARGLTHGNGTSYNDSPRDRQATGFAWIRSTRGARRPNRRRHSASHPAPLDLSASGVIIVELSRLIPRSLAALGAPRSLAALGVITCHSYSNRVPRSLAALGESDCHSYTCDSSTAMCFSDSRTRRTLADRPYSTLRIVIQRDTALPAGAHMHLQSTGVPELPRAILALGSTHAAGPSDRAGTG